MSSPKVGGDNPHLVIAAYLERVAWECVECRAEVVKLIAAKVNDDALAEEVVDKAIERVFARADRYGVEDEIENVKAFLVTTAERLLLDALAGKSSEDKLKRKAVSLDDEANVGVRNEVLDASAEALAGRLEVNQMARLALRNIEPEDMKLIQMRFELDMSFEQIGRELGVSHVTVSHRLEKLLATMRTELERQAQH